MLTIGKSALGGKNKKILLVFILIAILLFSFRDAKAQQAISCLSLGGICKSAVLCGAGSKIDASATDCISSLFCCVPETTPPGSSSGSSCLSLSGAFCQATCTSPEEEELSGSYYDCQQKCCKKVGSTNATAPSSGGKQATGTDCPAGTVCFVNPLQSDDPIKILSGLLTVLQGIVAIIAIIMIIIGGIMYMFSGVNEKSVETAKKIIGGAVIGLAIIVAAPAFLKELLGVLGGTNIPVDSSISNAPSLKTIAENILKVLLSIAGILAIIGLMVGSVFYTTAYGDEDRMKKGKDIVVASIIGVLIAMAALVIVSQIAVLVGSSNSSQSTANEATQDSTPPASPSNSSQSTTNEVTGATQGPCYGKKNDDSCNENGKSGLCLDGGCVIVEESR